MTVPANYGTEYRSLASRYECDIDDIEIMYQMSQYV